MGGQRVNNAATAAGVVADALVAAGSDVMVADAAGVAAAGAADDGDDGDEDVVARVVEVAAAVVAAMTRAGMVGDQKRRWSCFGQNLEQRSRSVKTGAVAAAAAGGAGGVLDPSC